MGRKKKTDMDQEIVRPRPALDPEAREQQMIALAEDLVERRLLDGSATSQETVHYLKLSTAKSRLEIEKLKAENELLKAKTEAVKANARMEELYAEAIAAMKVYTGADEGDEKNI